MPSDLEIAQAVTPRPIGEIAAEIGLLPEDLELYGRDKAKIRYQAIERVLSGSSSRGKLVLVTAITPTPAGEGKTTVTVGLAQALCKLGQECDCGDPRNRR